MSETIIFILECLGAVSFAITGVLVGVEAKLDFFGVCFVSCATVVGGGIMRDVILGITPPLVFTNITMILITLIVSTLVFFILYIKRSLYEKKDKIEQINNIFDAAGLGVFTVVGMNVAMSSGFENNFFFVVFLGMTTGCGGGILRDVIVSDVPFVLTKRIYAVASIAGGIVYYLLHVTFSVGDIISAVSGILVIFALRLLASVFKWDLPKAI